MAQGNLKPFFHIPLILALFLGLATIGCNIWNDTPVESPILLVGVDGVEWDLALPLIADGRMPTIERLMLGGRYGLLETLVPTESPVIWTTVATGMAREDHQILGFARKVEGKLELYDNRHRRSAALWNILSEYDRRVCVVGWWMTYPVEPVNGVMVAQTNTLEQVDTSGGRNVWKGTLRRGVPGQIHPAEQEAELMRILGEVEEDLPALTTRIFGQFPHEMTLLSRRIWSNCQWSFRADQTYSRISRQLIGRDEPFDLAMVYFGGSDVVGHRFYRYGKPEVFDHPPAVEQIENFKDVIADYYCWLDREIGRLIDTCPREVTVLVISDHGMVPVNRKKKFSPDESPKNVNSANHLHGPPGFFIAAGPFIEPAPGADTPADLRREDLRTVASVYDIAPTILAMLRLPLGLDMEGRVLEELFTPRFEVGSQPQPVKTHSTEAFQRGRHDQDTVNPGEEARIEQLQALGYIPEED